MIMTKTNVLPEHILKNVRNFLHHIHLMFRVFAIIRNTNKRGFVFSYCFLKISCHACYHYRQNGNENNALQNVKSKNLIDKYDRSNYNDQSSIPETNKSDTVLPTAPNDNSA